jgi:hypothetical protein
MLGRFNELADAAKTFAGSALTEFSQALEADNSEDEAHTSSSSKPMNSLAAPQLQPSTDTPQLQPVAVVPVTEPSDYAPMRNAARPTGPSHEAVEAMREAHNLEIFRLKTVLQALQDETDSERTRLIGNFEEMKSEIACLRRSLDEHQMVQRTKEAEIENLNLLLRRCVEEKSKLMLEKEETDVVDGKVLRPLFVQLCSVRDDSTQRLQTLKIIADVLRLSDLDREAARLPVVSRADLDPNSLAVPFISFLTSDLS